MSQEHGLPLTLLRTTKPTFRRTKGGGFDSGYRRFRCLSQHALTLLHNVFKPNRSDFYLCRAATGGTLNGHRLMALSEANIESEEGDRTIIRAEFEGLLVAKQGSIVFSCGTQEMNAVATVAGFTIIQGSNLDVPIPTVVHTWVSSKGRPNAVAPGTAATPPGITRFETQQAAQYHSNFATGMLELFAGWVLTNREMRAPGDVIRSRMWEVVDTYQFKVTQVPATALSP